MAYLSNSDADFKEMLTVIGVDSFDDLIENIPQDIRFKGSLNVPEAESEFGVSRILEQMSEKNRNYISFLGGGVYDHYSPAIIGAIISRSEYYTAYTPYQPEVSQGNLQLMYEFQSMISELTNMDVTNASMYEAGSALAEAALLSVSYSKRKKLLLSAQINPHYKNVLKTYVNNADIELVEIPEKNGITDMNALSSLMDDNVGGIIMQHPNYYGFFEDMETVAKFREDKKRLLIQVYDPISLGLIKTPGDFGADIAVAEGQSLGIPQNYGGPFVGLFSTTQKLVRLIPGRLAGITEDVNGKRGFVLTLQTREQHIRREKATSNITTNTTLNAIMAAINVALLGEKGFKSLSRRIFENTLYLERRLASAGVVVYAPKSLHFKRLTYSISSPENVLEKIIRERKIIPFSLLGDNYVQTCVTEVHEREDIDKLFKALKEEVESNV